MTGGGRRPLHLVRRGAVYYARFRLPVDLADRIGMVELQKSLLTKDLGEARRRCQASTAWFKAMMETLSAMPSPTRADLEAAARAFFHELAQEIDVKREFAEVPPHQAVEFNVDASEAQIRAWDDQLVSNQFDHAAFRLAERMMETSGLPLPDHDPKALLMAQKLAVRAAREQLVYFIHQLSVPATPFTPQDALFAPGEIVGIRSKRIDLDDEAAISRPLGDLTKLYLRKKAAIGLSQSQIDETARLLGWIEEVFGADRPSETITKIALRGFRDDVQRIDVTLRGRAGRFKDRLTNEPGNQIKSATYLRYWNTTKAFFSWCHSEGYIDADPAAGLTIEKRKGETIRTPEEFKTEEIKALFQTPLFAGYKSLSRLNDPGPTHTREGHWWSAIIMMHTGLRAGELSQLLPEDFDFDAATPHLKVRNEDDAGNTVKTTKNAASVRNVPLHPRLLELGLRQFVERRRKLHPTHRVLVEFRLGKRGRVSDGMTRFWADYLRRFGLWSPGRGNHVWRHTWTACLRANGALEEDIDAVIGHARKAMTARYGGKYPLHRMAETIARLEYGFDVVEALGGPYDAKRHAA
jgi:integrase